MTVTGGASSSGSGTGLFAARPHLVWLALFYALMLLAAGYAELLAIIPGTGISIWLPSGLLLGALLANERASWPWWIAVAAAAELSGNLLWFGNSLPVALLIICGNIGEAVVGALLIARFVGWPFRLATLRDVLGLVLLGAIAAPVVAASVGALTLLWAGGQQLAQAFWLFWIGDATGVLVAAAPIITVAEFWRRGRIWTSSRWGEAVALAAVLAVVTAASFTGQLPFGLIFLPLVLLASVRFHFWGSLASSLSLTILVAAFELWEINPFALIGQELEASLRLQLFLAISAFSGLVVAALARQYEETLHRLVESNRELERRVLERTASLSASEARLKKMMETAQVGIAFGDSSGTITGVNAALAGLLGTSADRLGGAGRSWESLLADDDRMRLREELARLTAEGRSGPIDLVFRLPDGGEVPAIWTASLLDSGEIVAFVVDQTRQKQHEEQISLLMRELNHRAKNILTLVQAVARQTRAASTSDFLEKFGQRIRSLAASQDLLVGNDWKGAPLESVVRGQLSHFEDALDSRITIEGPPVLLSAAAAQTVGLAIHELSTNAGKYGALSVPAGRVTIRWAPVSGDRLAFSWVESGGPPVSEPAQKGFGSTVLDAVVRSSLGCSVEIVHDPAGLRWRIEAPLDMLSGAKRETEAK